MTSLDHTRTQAALTERSSLQTLAEYNTMQATTMTESALQNAIIAQALRKGWLIYHTYDSRRSQPGFPDLTLVHPGHGLLLFRETQKGTTTAQQKKWLAALAAAGQDAKVWRPIDWYENRIDDELAPDPQ